MQYHDANQNYQLESKKEDNAQQFKIAESNQRSITGQNGRPVALTSAAKETLAREDVLDLRHVALLNEMELKHPLVRFVSAPSLDGAATAMDAAPKSEKVWVKGAELQAAIARAAAK